MSNTIAVVSIVLLAEVGRSLYVKSKCGDIRNQKELNKCWKALCDQATNSYLSKKGGRDFQK